MKTLVIPINGECFSKCIFCQFKRFNGNNQIKTSEIKKYEEIYKKNNSKEVMITDGEPLNHTKILEIIESILNFTDNLIIDTNGEKLSDLSFCKKLKEITGTKNITFKIPIYGSTEKIHNLITHGNLKLVLKGILNLKKLNIDNVKIHCLTLKQNYKDLGNIKTLTDKLGYKLDFIYTIPDGYIDLSKIMLSFSQTYQENKDLIIKNIPKCINSNGLNIKNNENKTTILDGKIMSFKDDFSSDRLLKVFVQKCKNCKYKNNCDGIYYKYLKEFGENEFKKN